MCLRKFSYLFLTILSFLLNSLSAQSSILISELPNPLILPTQQTLTATIEEENIKCIWLAPSQDSRGRIILEKVKEKSYQINLADPCLVGLLRAGGGGGEFKIFAQDAQGKVTASKPILYSFEPVKYTLPKLYIYTALGQKELTGVYSWVKAKDIIRIQAHFTSNPFLPFARIKIADRIWSFVFLQENILDLTITEEIRKAWQENGSLMVQCEGHGNTIFTMKAIPENIELSDQAEWTLVQRHSTAIPGSKGYLLFHIGDITGGHWSNTGGGLTVTANIQTADYHQIVSTSLRSGSEVAFDFDNKRYRLLCLRLVDKLFDDYGEFRLIRLPD
jgi:hypothetical protein